MGDSVVPPPVTSTVGALSDAMAVKRSAKFRRLATLPRGNQTISILRHLDYFVSLHLSLSVIQCMLLTFFHGQHLIKSIYMSHPPTHHYDY